MSAEQFYKAQVAITEATYAQYSSYGYAAGYFQSLAEQMFRRLSKRQQAEFLRQVELDAARLEALAKISA